MEVAYLGPQKTFTERAAREMFPSATLIPYFPIRKVIETVKGPIDYAVVPVENFYDGPVQNTFDALTDNPQANIVQEKALKIIHCFGALPGHHDIKRIFSKDTALNQCWRYISQYHPSAETFPADSTALAAENIVKDQQLDAAVIASEDALINGGLEILARDICPNNLTRFVALRRGYRPATGDDKTIIAIHPHVSDEPGVLANCLNILKSLKMNLESIHSRPDGMGMYTFYLEHIGSQDDTIVRAAHRAIRLSLDPKEKYQNTLTVLGSFPNTHWKERSNEGLQ